MSTLTLSPLRSASFLGFALVALSLACAACAGEEGASAEDPAGSAEEAVRAGTWLVNGSKLNAAETRWLQFVAKEVVPHLPGTDDDKRTLAARGFWWALKEGNLERGTVGTATNPVGYNLCNTPSGDKNLGPLGTCDDDPLARDQTLYGRAWQVGVAGVQVPGRRIDKTEALALSLYPGKTIDQLLEDTAELAGYARGSQTSQRIVASKGALRLSWLLRIPAAGFVDVVTKEVVSECIQGSKSYCYGSGWDETRKFAPSKSAAMRSISDLSGIFRRLMTDGGGGAGGDGGADGGTGGTGGGCWSPTLDRETEELACVQSASNRVYYQCKDGEWVRGVAGNRGPHGLCASMHPL